MNVTERQNIIYGNLIREFKNTTQDIYHNLWLNRHNAFDLSGLFIPQVFNDYGIARKNYFYVGQDTYGWTGLDKVYNLSEEDYLLENNKWPNCVENILAWKSPYTFWNFVARLHLALNNQDNDMSKISDSQKMILNQIGWGNLYSLELVETIKKNLKINFEAFDRDIYEELWEKSKKISKLENIIEAYSPDYVIILAWKEEAEKWFFKGLTLEILDKESIKGFLCVCKVKNTNTKIFWTYHPQALCWKKQDLTELITLIKERQ